jgi:hypothetical protein
LATGRAWTRGMKEIIKNNTQNIKIIFAKDILFENQLKQISKLNKETIVLMGAFFN